MFGLYKKALDDSNGLTVLLTMVLLDDTVYKAQRNALIDFVKTVPAKDANGLQLVVHNALCELGAAQWKAGVAFGAAGFLWKAKQGSVERK